MRIQGRWFRRAAQRIVDDECYHSCVAVLDSVPMDNWKFKVAAKYAQLMAPTTDIALYWIDAVPFWQRKEMRTMLLLFAGEALHGEEIK